jgi:hypothetical protein
MVITNYCVNIVGRLIDKKTLIWLGMTGHVLVHRELEVKDLLCKSHPPPGPDEQLQCRRTLCVLENDGVLLLP